jgi:acyl-CoA synthetase (NDP forming)
MKAQAAALGHKSDAGGVLLNLADGAAVRAAGAHVRQCRGLFGSIRLDGVLIEAMGKRGWK